MLRSVVRGTEMMAVFCVLCICELSRMMNVTLKHNELN